MYITLLSHFDISYNCLVLGIVSNNCVKQIKYPALTSIHCRYRITIINKQRNIKLITKIITYKISINVLQIINDSLQYESNTCMTFTILNVHEKWA